MNLEHQKARPSAFFLIFQDLTLLPDFRSSTNIQQHCHELVRDLPECAEPKLCLPFSYSMSSFLHVPSLGVRFARPNLNAGEYMSIGRELDIEVTDSISKTTYQLTQIVCMWWGTFHLGDSPPLRAQLPKRCARDVVQVLLLWKHE